MHHPFSPPTRPNPADPYHHPWRNHGKWFARCAEHHTPIAKVRIGASLRTAGKQCDPPLGKLSGRTMA